jgi:aerobic-type carbon monoxide dehydrogenase small subunit (CoxS/CutS family)
MDGREVLTVEGIDRYPELQRLQEAFIDEGGLQCGYCTSGQLMTAASLLLSDGAERLSESDVRHHMLGNLCRCTGYYGILRAIESAISSPAGPEDVAV